MTDLSVEIKETDGRPVDMDEILARIKSLKSRIQRLYSSVDSWWVVKLYPNESTEIASGPYKEKKEALAKAISLIRQGAGHFRIRRTSDLQKDQQQA